MPLAEPIVDLRSIDLFASVAKLGSIQKAAKLHQMTQPAVSMRISSLESVLGVKLLDRSSRGSTLTQTGSVVARWCDRILFEVDDLMIGCKTLAGSQKSEIKIASSLTIAEHYVPGWIASLKARFDKLSVSLKVVNSENVVELISSRAVDVGFIETSKAPSLGKATGCKTFSRDKLELVVAPSSPLARRKRPVVPNELASMALVVREFGSGTREVLESTLASQGLSLVVAAEMGSNTSIVQAAEAGLAPAVLSEMVVADSTSHGRLVRVPLDGIEFIRPLRVIWNKATMTEHTRFLIGLMLTNV